MFHPETQKELVKSHHKDIFKESEGSRLRNIGKTRPRSRSSLIRRLFMRFRKVTTSSVEELKPSETKQRLDRLIQEHEM
jgi:hypothetical protein